MSFRSPVACLMFAIVLLHGNLLRAESWEHAARTAGLDSHQIRQLARDKFLMTDKSLLQIFSAYVEPRGPVFITSDSILNAYHVLLEESVLRLEQANAAELPGILRFVWRNLNATDRAVQVDPALALAAQRRAQIVVGTALALLDGSVPEVDAETAGLIKDEVSRIEQAEGLHKPRWLDGTAGADIEALDYSRYRPRGFYAATELLSRYFRAVSWLQSIPFRVDCDEELVAALWLGDCLAADRLAGDTGRRQQYAAFFQCFREFLGDHDDWDLWRAATDLSDGLQADFRAGRLPQVRRSLQAKAAQRGAQPQVNDQVKDPGPPTLSYRILSAFRTPDAVLFQQTTDPLQFRRPFPTGLEICIALGSSFAPGCLDDPDRDKLLETIERSKVSFSGTNLSADYYRCLSTLLGPPPPGAPQFMSGGAWQAKSCQTALAGWAQWRHTWILQSKQTCMLRWGEDWKKPVGFVEPNPAFFAELRGLADRTAGLLERVKNDTDHRIYAIAALQNLLHILEAKQASGGPLKFDDGSSTDEFFAQQTLQYLIRTNWPEMGRSQGKASPAEFIPKVKEALLKMQQGELQREVDVLGWSSSNDQPLGKLWRDLASLAERLQQLAEKQLAGERFTPADRDFIVTYGRPLARLMSHTGDPSETPRDDVPRVADVVYNPNLGQYLEVGVGRPRFAYVLYPHAGGDVLCCGAVLPYYEYRSATRLDDNQWKDLLDSNAAPQPAIQGEAFVTAIGLAAPPAESRWQDYGALVLAVGAAMVIAVIVALRRRARRRSLQALARPQFDNGPTTKDVPVDHRQASRRILGCAPGHSGGTMDGTIAQFGHDVRPGNHDLDSRFAVTPGRQ